MQLSKKQLFIDITKRHLKDLLVLYISFSISLNVRHLFNKPADDFFGVERTMQGNPESNYIFILAIILLTLSFFAIIKWVDAKRPAFFKPLIVLILSLSFLVGIVAPNFARYENNIDTFHHGEQLAPASAYDQGSKPYKDLFFLRGAGEDVITPWLSFKLFGRSVGSYYLMTGLLQTVSFSLFLIFLAYLFKSRTSFLLVSLWFTLSIFGDFFYVRDIFVWLTLILMLSLIKTRSYKRLRLFSIGFLSMVSLFYSFDRGVFLLSLNFIILGLFIINLILQRGNKKHFRISLQHLYRTLSFVFAGYIGSLIAIALLFGVGVFGDFFKTTFLQAAKYQGYIFNTDYPLLSQNNMLFWLPIVILVVLSIEVIRSIKKAWPTLSTEHFVEIILLVFSILFFRAATGRPDQGHIAYGSPLIFVALFYIFLNRINKIDYKTFFVPLIFVFIACFSTSFINYYKLPAMNQVSLKPAKTFFTAPNKPDSFWETEEVEIITNEIKSRTINSDYFFVFSSDPIFYYTTGLVNPTRFSISWFADPQPLESEMLEGLKKNPPRIVLYESGTYYDRPEFVSMKQRLPQVDSWLNTNYTEPISIEGTSATIRIIR